MTTEKIETKVGRTLAPKAWNAVLLSRPCEIFDGSLALQTRQEILQNWLEKPGASSWSEWEDWAMLRLEQFYLEEDPLWQLLLRVFLYAPGAPSQRMTRRAQFALSLLPKRALQNPAEYSAVSKELLPTLRDPQVYWNAVGAIGYVDKCLRTVVPPTPQTCMPQRYTDMDWATVRRAVHTVCAVEDVSFLPLVRELYGLHQEKLVRPLVHCSADRVSEELELAGNTGTLLGAVEFLEAVRKRQKVDLKATLGADLKTRALSEVFRCRPMVSLQYPLEFGVESEVTVKVAVETIPACQQALESLLADYVVTFWSEGIPYEQVRPLTPGAVYPQFQGVISRFHGAECAFVITPPVSGRKRFNLALARGKGRERVEVFRHFEYLEFPAS